MRAMDLGQIDNPRHVDIFLQTLDTVFRSAERDFVLPVFFDFDDTIVDQKAMTESKQPKINQCMVFLTAQMIHRFSLERLQFSIISTRRPDDEINKKYPSQLFTKYSYLLISSALPVFYDELNHVLRFLDPMTTQKNFDLFETRIYYCNPNMPQAKMHYFSNELHMTRQDRFVFIDDQVEENCAPVKKHFPNAHVLQSIVVNGRLTVSALSLFVPAAQSVQTSVKIWRGLHPSLRDQVNNSDTDDFEAVSQRPACHSDILQTRHCRYFAAPSREQTSVVLLPSNSTRQPRTDEDSVCRIM